MKNPFARKKKEAPQTTIESDTQKASRTVKFLFSWRPFAIDAGLSAATAFLTKGGLATGISGAFKAVATGTLMMLGTVIAIPAALIGAVAGGFIGHATRRTGRATVNGAFIGAALFGVGACVGGHALGYSLLDQKAEAKKATKTFNYISAKPDKTKTVAVDNTYVVKPVFAQP